MEHKNVFLKAILSGVFVVLTVTMYLITLNTVSNSKVISSVLFSFALLVIVGRNYYLYTGKIGSLLPNFKDNYKMILTTLLGNVVGIIITGLLMNLSNIEGLSNYANNLVIAKFDNKLWYESFILAIFCGVLMFTAVDGYSKIDDKIIKVLVVILSVAVFLLAGFEHSIANIVYVVLSKGFSFKIFGYLLLMLLGNAVGSIVMNLIHEKIK